MSRVRASLFAAVLTAGLATFIAASSHKHALELTQATYAESIGDGKVYFVKYFAPWCGHCKQLAPIWEEMAESFKDNKKIVIATVDCTEHKSVCTDADVKGYPTLKVMYDGKEYKSYRGPRNLAALQEFVTSSADELLSETEE